MINLIYISENNRTSKPLTVQLQLLSPRSMRSDLCLFVLTSWENVCVSKSRYIDYWFVPQNSNNWYLPSCLALIWQNVMLELFSVRIIWVSVDNTVSIKWYPTGEHYKTTMNVKWSWWLLIYLKSICTVPFQGRKIRSYGTQNQMFNIFIPVEKR